jgi:hypothetical protein
VEKELGLTIWEGSEQASIAFKRSWNRSRDEEGGTQEISVWELQKKQ